MDSIKDLENQMKEINTNSSNAQFKNIKSKYILKLIFDYLNEKKCFDIIKYTKKIQQTINKNSNDYKKLLEIEIEIKFLIKIKLILKKIILLILKKRIENTIIYILMTIKKKSKEKI